MSFAFDAAMTLETADPLESAAVAGLRYVNDEGPGIRRKRAGQGLQLCRAGWPAHPRCAGHPADQVAGDPASLEDVWICADPDGHIQATGRDARGRKQYRYHPRWREVRDAAKYERLAAFGRGTAADPRARRARPAVSSGMPRSKVLATIVKLLEETSIRIGNEEYRRQNQSFGLTTMLDRHARFDGSAVRFEFKGKSGRQHSVKLTDRRLARIVKQCQEIPGQELFQYLDEDGQRHSIESSDVNDYLREISGGDFTAKDFRTWNGTVLALRYLRVCESPTLGDGGQAAGIGRDQERRAGARQHARGVPQGVRASGGAQCLPRRLAGTRGGHRAKSNRRTV